MTTLEQRLAALEARLAETRKAAGALATGLQRLSKAAGQGHLAEIEKSLSLVTQRAEEVRQSAATLPGAWSSDARQYLDQEYVAELRNEARVQGVNLIERDGRLYCFPLALRLDPAERAVKIGKKREQRLRPKTLVATLAKMQKEKPRFNAPRILETLYQVYRRIQREAWEKLESGAGPAMPVADVFELLTLLPGSDYSVEEFGRDLLLLSREPDLKTRDGSVFEFLGSTLSKERIRRVVVYDENGQEVPFLAVRFSKGT
jgi:hypothetical protein